MEQRKSIYPYRVPTELYHHGILGQKWGKRNGPPYPLDSGDHSASEKKAGWRKSLDKGGSTVKSAKRKIGNRVDKSAKKGYTSSQKKQKEKAHIPKYNAETPVWRLSPGQKKTKLKDVSDEDAEKGKKALKKVLIASGVVAVTALTAYALYKHHKTVANSKFLEELQKQAVATAMAQYEANKAKYEAANKLAKGLAQSNANVPISALNRTFSSPAEFTSKVQDISSKTMSRGDNLFSKPYWDSLSTDQKNAVIAYSGTHSVMSYKGMNKLLRAGEESIPKEHRATVKKLVDDCAEALEHSVLTEDAVSYRGVPLHTVEKMLGGINLNEIKAKDSTQILSKQFTESAFYSSSINKSQSFPGVKITTIVPKGTKGMYIAPVSNFSGEMELLLQRGTEFKIVDFETDAIGKLVGLTVEAIKQL